MDEPKVDEPKQVTTPENTTVVPVEYKTNGNVELPNTGMVSTSASAIFGLISMASGISLLGTKRRKD